jgi:predicted aminopeptidase
VINKVLFSRVVIAASLLVVTTLVGGCSTVGYYSQAIDGQLTILMRREPIAELIADPATTPELKQKLEQVLRMRRFAVDSLGLPDNASYTTYVDLERPYVVWNVFAAPEFSLTPRQWCYPVAGCVSYRGYFNEHDANRFADKMKQAGNDVYVAGISAYSTLGWFHDPLLNTMLTRSETRLAGILFHELAHQRLYAKGDTTFNESFATAVELEGLRRWLLQNNQADQYQQYQKVLQRKLEFIELVQGARQKLKALYASVIPDRQKRDGKRQILAELKQDYRQLRTRWGGYRGYDAWFARDLNNAHLVPIGSYYDYVAAFQTLLNQHSGDLKAFYKSAGKLVKLSPEMRHQALEQLMPKR